MLPKGAIQFFHLLPPQEVAAVLVHHLAAALLAVLVVVVVKLVPGMPGHLDKVLQEGTVFRMLLAGVAAAAAARVKRGQMVFPQSLVMVVMVFLRR